MKCLFSEMDADAICKAIADDAKRARPADNEPADERQHVLFAGMNCLPGQQDLFETDGDRSNARHA